MTFNNFVNPGSPILKTLIPEFAQSWSLDTVSLSCFLHKITPRLRDKIVVRDGLNTAQRFQKFLNTFRINLAVA